MEYFMMKTDKRLFNLPQMELPKELSANNIIYVKGNHGMDIVYADYLEKPIPLVSDKLQNILQKYQQDMVLQRVMLIERETGMQKAYYFMKPPEIVCVGNVEFSSDNEDNMKNFVLDIEKVGNRKIFLAKDYRRQLLVRLDVAESILRRDANGIWFEPVKTIGRSW